MTKKRKQNETHIHLNTYNSIEGAVLIHVHSYDWTFTPATRPICRKNILEVLAQEKAKKRIFVAFKNGKQILEKGIL
jgi:hypothetical protein